MEAEWNSSRSSPARSPSRPLGTSTGYKRNPHASHNAVWEIRLRFKAPISALYQHLRMGLCFGSRRVMWSSSWRLLTLEMFRRALWANHFTSGACRARASRVFPKQSRGIVSHTRPRLSPSGRYRSPFGPLLWFREGAQIGRKYFQ